MHGRRSVETSAELKVDEIHERAGSLEERARYMRMRAETAHQSVTQLVEEIHELAGLFEEHARYMRMRAETARCAGEQLNIANKHSLVPARTAGSIYEANSNDYR